MTFAANTNSFGHRDASCAELVSTVCHIAKLDITNFAMWHTVLTSSAQDASLCPKELVFPAERTSACVMHHHQQQQSLPLLLLLLLVVVQ